VEVAEGWAEAWSREACAAEGRSAAETYAGVGAVPVLPKLGVARGSQG